MTFAHVSLSVIRSRISGACFFTKHRSNINSSETCCDVEKVNATLEKVRIFIERHSMLNGARGIVVAVSGGADSVALLDILSRLMAGEHQRSIPRLSLHVAHLNHMLRGRESDEDAEFVRAMAEQLELPFTGSASDVRQEARISGKGMEETAREIRYDFLFAAAQKSGCNRIATGHTMNDQAETLLMRLARGAGLRGLAAMRPVTPAHFFGDREIERAEKDSLLSCAPAPLLIRPLLHITRDEVEEYCRDNQLVFRTDSTNFDTDYARNQIRLNVLPALRAINPRAVESIAGAAEIASRDQDALEHIASSLLDRARKDAPGQTHYVYEVAALLAQPLAIRRRMIMEAICRARVGENRAQISSKHIQAVEPLLEQRTSGNRIMLPGSVEVWREFDSLVFKSSSEKTGYVLEIGGEQTRVEAGGFIITLLRDQPGHLLRALIAEAQSERDRTGRNWMVAVLDDRAVPDKLLIRPRKPGERAHAIGRRRAKKLKSLMINHKIPSSRRDVWPVLVTSDGRYAWSPGLPPSAEFAARDESRSLAILRAAIV